MRLLSTHRLDITKLRWLKLRDASSAICCSREFSAVTACPSSFSPRLTFYHVLVSESASVFVSVFATVRYSSRQIASLESSTKAWRAFKGRSTRRQSLRLPYRVVRCVCARSFIPSIKSLRSPQELFSFSWPCRLRGWFMILRMSARFILRRSRLCWPAKARVIVSWSHSFSLSSLFRSAQYTLSKPERFRKTSMKRSILALQCTRHA